MAKVFDLTKGEGCFTPLPLGGRHRYTLETAVLRTIQEIPGAKDEVLSTYSPKNTVWDVPPLYTGEYRGVGLQVGPDERKSNDPTDAVTYVRLLNKLAVEGWSHGFKRMLETRFKSSTGSQWLFTQGGQVGQFAAEFAVAVSRVHGNRMIVGDDTVALYVPVQDDVKMIGILEGRVIGAEDYKVTPSEIFDWTLCARGLVTTKNYGVYDRILRWAELNYESVTDIDKLRIALSILKLGQDHTKPFCEHEVLFEKRVRDRAGAEEPERLTNNFTYEKLTRFRNLWLEAHGLTPEEAFQNLFEAIVPDLYDSEKFKAMFGMLPELDMKLTRKQVLRIDRGITKLEHTYLKEKRD